VEDLVVDVVKLVAAHNYCPISRVIEIMLAIAGPRA